MYYLGFDIGGSSVKAVLAAPQLRSGQANKKIVKSVLRDLPDSLEGLLVLVGGIKDELVEGVAPEQIGGAGFSLAGIMDLDRRAVLLYPNIKHLSGQPIGDLLQQTCAPWRIKLEHDVHCFLIAEKEAGLAKNLKSVFYLTLGTGIGGAFMIDGKIIFGAHGSAGEAGHMIMEAAVGLDFEDLASNKFIKKELGVSSFEAEKMARGGDRVARAVFDRLGENIGIGAANIINIFDPEAIIIGGGIVGTSELIMPGIERNVEKFVISPAAKKTKILFSELGRFGGALGAALMMADDRPFD